VLVSANWKFYKLKKQVWFWVCAYAILGALTALLAILASRFIPISENYEGFGSEAVATILSILASSMLAVTTFSLSIMVQAFSSAASSATPRSTSLMLSDSTSQIVLSTFLGAFVYSVVGIIGLQSEIYGAAGRLVLFWVTMVVLVAVLWQLVRWISHLSKFGRLGDTIDRVEAATIDAIKAMNDRPLYGGCPVPERFNAPLLGTVTSNAIGYIEFVDGAAIQALAEKHDIDVHLCDLPGGFVHDKSVLFKIYGSQSLSDDLVERLAKTVTVMSARNFEQDPRFGIVALSEIASRALSAGINDNGTAIDVFGRLVRFLAHYDPDATKEPLYDRLFVERLKVSDMMEDAFLTTIRDAAGMLEVHLRIQKTLLALVELKPQVFAKYAVHYSDRSLLVSQNEMLIDSDIERVRRMNMRVKEQATLPEA
jgi:uncharacterized membrane protein